MVWSPRTSYVYCSLCVVSGLSAASALPELVFRESNLACRNVYFPKQSTCVALNLIPFILQSLIMLGIIIAMNFSVTQLRVMVNNSPWVPSTPLQVTPQ
jgi:predicted neutral ceramidase superfamily lipid hydrolase